MSEGDKKGGGFNGCLRAEGGEGGREEGEERVKADFGQSIFGQPTWPANLGQN